MEKNNFEELKSAVQWLLDDMFDAGELRSEEGGVFDSVASAVIALHNAGGSVEEHLLADSEAYAKEQGWDKEEVA